MCLRFPPPANACELDAQREALDALAGRFSADHAVNRAVNADNTVTTHEADLEETDEPPDTAEPTEAA
jgi:hypothetical protein